MKLIDADVAKKAVHEEFDECLVWDESGEYTSNVIEEILEALPTIDAEPVRHGYWRNYKDEHTCSCCGETITGDWYDKDNDTYWYCPWCGAKMDAERKEE